jgi:hypothetical protein
MSIIGRRLTALAIGSALAVAPMLTVAQPAHATDCSELYAESGFTGSHVYSEKYRFCEGGGVIPLNAFVQQKNPVTGQWVTVASRPGFAAYRCNGSATRWYRFAAIGSGTPYPCG